MGYCAIVDCDELGVNLVTMPTSWGTWEHWICDPHKTRVDNGDVMLHDPDYRVTLQPPAAKKVPPSRRPSPIEQIAIPEQTRGSGHDAHVPLQLQRHRSRQARDTA